MAGPIQTIPQGLLGFLQLKQTGRNPTELLETVQPMVDMFPLWVQRLVVDLAQSTQTVPTASPSTAMSFTPGIKVPDSVAWFVTDYTIECSLLAAETIVMAPSYFSSVAAVAPAGAHQLAPFTVDIITVRARRLKTTARNFWLGPGNQLNFSVNDSLTAGNITVQGSVRGFAVPV